MVLLSCANAIICDNKQERHLFGHHGHLLCLDCKTNFGHEENQKGKLPTKEFCDERCPICLEAYGPLVSYSRCDHYVCVDCFKQCHGAEKEMLALEPVFPYPEISDAYFSCSMDDDEDGEEMTEEEIESQYPLLKKYEHDWNMWNDMHCQWYEDNEYLKKCPVCRS